jgi:hypothetical protein
MSSEQAAARNRLVIPGVALIILAFVFIAFWLLTRDGGGNDTPKASPSTASTTPASTKTVTDRLEPSGTAPAAIAVKDVTVARSAAGFGLAADIPAIDLDKFATVTLVIGQNDGAILWNLTTIRDPRGVFINPELRRVEGDDEQQFACPGASVRIKATRLAITMPLRCLDNPEKPVKARLELTDQDGGKERTSVSKTLSAPAG